MQHPVDPTQLDDLETWMAHNAAGRDEANRLARAELSRARATIASVRAYIADPGNWSALDGRRAHLLRLLDGTP